ncbi:hypothetical protein M409DRAFT_23513 [Zasmidium cellare ATCC 36951]|uniref:F-box domain-containing protein n=1 Tax=Zasmidium cellare ATCC 36951 TaxID=1080233 RepID=A0A6A6CK46_ZASCE|nr:uncharacterized protein M409DRAFT_23513 [Zasmidium cellare ATCC 36951]KAF2166322.1 hypothetical protein M409DRAFT_23513 [Zasmidium cellare ATCC 36951]
MSTDAELTMATTKKTFMDLPREVFLMICAYLTPKDLTRLAHFSKDCYLAVQQPLYEHIDITAIDELRSLVWTLGRWSLIVSHLSAKQRQHWQKLTDAQLCARDIKKVTILVDAATNTKSPLVGVDFARYIGTISRASNNVNIELSLHGKWTMLLMQLSSSTSSLPDVKRLVLCLGGEGRAPVLSVRAPNWDVWDTCFSGSTFPDLKEIEIDTLHGSPAERPETLKAAASANRASHISRYQEDGAVSIPFYGLRKITKLSIKHNDLLTTSTLGNLFCSSIIPAKLTHLEIVNCPMLHQVRDYEDLSILLQRGLPLLQHFRFHLQRNPRGAEHLLAAYYKDTAEHPEWHLCNVVRELGQKIKSLDLALPFACNRMFVPRTKQAPAALAERDWPDIAREPYETLRERLLSAGYKYRRLICWDSVCGKNHEWQDMLDLADNQGDMMSWEIVSNRDKTASWHVSGFLPMSYKSSEVLKRELPLEGR